MHVCRYARRTGDENTRDAADTREQSVLRERFVVVVVVVVFVLISETRVSPSSSSVMRNVIALVSRASIFITVRGARSEKHDLIYHGPHNSRRRVMLEPLPFFDPARYAPTSVRRHSTMRGSCLDIPLGVLAGQPLKKIALLQER